MNSNGQSSYRILILDDEPAIIYALSTLLERQGYTVVSEDNSSRALQLIQSGSFHLIISDIFMTPIDGFTILTHANQCNPPIPVIMITGYGSIESALKSLELGAYDYITKPFNFNDLLEVIHHALLFHQHQQPESGIKTIPTISRSTPRYYYRSLVGDSLRMRQIYYMIERWENQPSPVIIQGEHGTGRSHLAWVLHNLAFSTNHPFCEIKGEGSVEQFCEALFKADQQLQQLPGTLFFDDIDQLIPTNQTALLRYLEHRSKHLSQWRLIVSTTSDLHHLAINGRFLDSLYYRLTGITIELPPLRKRLEDLPLLVSHFLTQWEKQTKSSPIVISTSVMNTFHYYSWPENIRELRNVIFYACKQCHHGVIQTHHLPQHLAHWVQSDSGETYQWQTLRRFLQHHEREFIQELIYKKGMQEEEAAAILKRHPQEIKEILKGSS